MRGTLFDWNVIPSAADAANGEPAWVSSYLRSAGIEDGAARDIFLNPRFESLPLPTEFRFMAAAVARTMGAIRKGETVAVYGDYDCDGTCSSAIVVDVLKRAGYAGEPLLHLPHREKEGYGLNAAAVRMLAEKGCTLVITTDCGSSNVKEIALAKELAMDTIVLDHHQRPPEIPDAYAIVNSAWPEETFPYKGLCATGVAYFFADELLRAAGSDYSSKWYLDLTAVATIGDLMPLTGVNRALVSFGLQVLRKTRRVGLQALMRAARIEQPDVTAENVAFGIVPRINAAGRMDHANAASELLRCEDAQRAKEMAEALNNTNVDRQEGTKRYVEEAAAQLVSQKGKNGRVVVSDAWPHGLLGLIAGRICEQEHAVAIAVAKHGTTYVASGRSPKSVNVMDLLNATAARLLKFGGHPQACGFSIEGDENFAQWRREAETWFAGLPALSSRKVLTAYEGATASNAAETYEWMQRLSPFGMGVPSPLFLLGPVAVGATRDLGDSGKHLAITFVGKDGTTVRGVLFGQAEEFKKSAIHNAATAKGETYAVVQPVANAWRGRVSYEYHVKDWTRA